ncbi:MAG: ABC transporter ATP-binding protein [Bryobacterales bacterium]|nr:ABC transporter ATP-binding protein [Bryobacteraceae bacterium]MDW8356096.1 ABC transporter ATP-binding protein [Bryobacterales bacterium]
MNRGIEAIRLTLRRNGREILSEINLTIQPGAVHMLVGPNGSGKSTLLRVLCALWRPDRGQVRFDGKDLSRMSRRELARKIVLVPQETRFDYAITVKEAVSMGCYAHRSRWSPPSARDIAAVERSQALCDLKDLTGRLVNTLSSGERQRVAIARGLAAEPEFLLLDEPTASLDVRHGLGIFMLVRRLVAEGHGVVVATHDLGAALRYGDRLVLLDRGRCVHDGPAERAVASDLLGPVFRVRAETGRSPSGTPYVVFHSLEEEFL